MHQRATPRRAQPGLQACLALRRGEVGGQLVAIGQTQPAGCERLARLFEIVSNEANDRQQGRLRWKSYAAKGWQVNPHEVKE